MGVMMMTLFEKIDCIFDEIEDKELSEKQAKAYIEGAEHAFCLCNSERIKEINSYFDEKRENHST